MTWIKVLAIKLDGLGSIPTTSGVEGKNQLLKVVLRPPQACHNTHTYTTPLHHTTYHTTSACDVYVYV